MCEPVSITMAVIAVAGAAASISAQQQAQSAAKKQQMNLSQAHENANIENRRRVTQDYFEDVRLQRKAQGQERTATRENIGQIAEQSSITKATAGAHAAERNVAGATLEQINDDYTAQEERAIGRQRLQQKWRDEQRDETLKNSGRMYTNSIADIKPFMPTPIAPVDYVGPILQGAQGAMGAYSSFRTSQAPTRGTQVNVPGQSQTGLQSGSSQSTKDIG